MADESNKQPKADIRERLGDPESREESQFERRVARYPEPPA
jgi:hypothetical protein